MLRSRIEQTSKLSSLSIGSLHLTPTFDGNVFEYETTTTNNTNKIKAVAENDSDEITIKVNGETVNNDSSTAWLSGENIVEVTVNNTTYRVIVRKG